MGSHKKNNFYGVVCGRVSPIVTTWGVASVLVHGHPGARHHASVTFNEMKEWMEEQGHPQFHFNMPMVNGMSPEGRAPKANEPGFYAVAKGRNRGIHTTYEFGALMEVKGYSGCSFKKFRTYEEAQLFIEEHDMASKAVVGNQDSQDALSSIVEGVVRLSLEYSSSNSSDM